MPLHHTIPHNLIAHKFAFQERNIHAVTRVKICDNSRQGTATLDFLPTSFTHVTADRPPCDITYHFLVLDPGFAFANAFIETRSKAGIRVVDPDDKR